MTRELADNLNRVGLILGFVSFWFAAPEFIGEPRLKSWETKMAKGLGTIGKLPEWPLTILIAFTFYAAMMIVAIYFHKFGDWLFSGTVVAKIVHDVFLVGAGFCGSVIVARRNRIVSALAK